MRDPSVAADIPATDLTPDERLALAACAIIVGTEVADLRSMPTARLIQAHADLGAARQALRTSGVKPRELRALGACLARGVGSELIRPLELRDQERESE